MNKPTDKLYRLRMFWAAYQPHQLRAYRLAREWMENGVTAQDATAWANLGYLPGEAKPLIEQGITPEMAAAAEQAASEVDSHEARAFRTIDDLVAQGVLIDPVRVRQVPDPNDPDRITVYID